MATLSYTILKPLDKTYIHHLYLYIHYSSFTCQRSRSLLPHKEKPTNWNTTHSFIHSTPLLSRLEKCNSMAQLKIIQAQMIGTGLISDGLAASRLVAFCAISEHGCLDYCRKLLLFTRQSKVFSWNVSIKGELERGNLEQGVLLYKEMMQCSGLRPDNYSFPLVFKCCARLGWVRMGYRVFRQVLRLGFESDVFVNNAVIHAND